MPGEEAAAGRPTPSTFGKTPITPMAASFKAWTTAGTRAAPAGATVRSFAPFSFAAELNPKRSVPGSVLEQANR